MRVLVAGAGPAGLTTAVELARRGVEVEVIDMRESGSGLSRAVGIIPASLEILRPSGVTERLLAEGVKYAEVSIYRGKRLVLTVPFEPGGGFILGLPPPPKGATPICVECGKPADPAESIEHGSGGYVHHDCYEAFRASVNKAHPN